MNREPPFTALATSGYVGGWMAGAVLGMLGLMNAMAGPFPLWPEGAPGATGNATGDVPTLTRFAPAEPRSAATVVILPGGGYGSLAKHEGEGFARWFASQGLTAYVLAYRLGSAGYRHPAMLQDAARAVRTARARAREEGLDPAKIVIVGSSAGGHLASTALTQFDAGDATSPDPVERESSRPDAGILCYPVITLEGPFAHGGSRKNLLGPDPAPALVRALSSEQRVTPQTPPCFIWHCAPDAVVPVENAFLFASALRKAGVPFALHVYGDGNHGIGMPATNRSAPPWDIECLRWLRSLGLLEPTRKP